MGFYRKLQDAKEKDEMKIRRKYLGLVKIFCFDWLIFFLAHGINLDQVYPQYKFFLSQIGMKLLQRIFFLNSICDNYLEFLKSVIICGRKIIDESHETEMGFECAWLIIWFHFVELFFYPQWIVIRFSWFYFFFISNENALFLMQNSFIHKKYKRVAHGSIEQPFSEFRISQKWLFNFFFFVQTPIPRGKILHMSLEYFKVLMELSFFFHYFFFFLFVLEIYC